MNKTEEFLQKHVNETLSKNRDDVTIEKLGRPNGLYWIIGVAGKELNLKLEDKRFNHNSPEALDPDPYYFTCDETKQRVKWEYVEPYINVFNEEENTKNNLEADKFLNG